MKLITRYALCTAIICMITGTALAVDIGTLDRVSVRMSRSEVVALLGTPDEVAELAGGMAAEIYRVTGQAPLVGTGCIYGDDQRLVGQSFILQGELGSAAAGRLVQLGFTVLDSSEGHVRLVGRDDDTGHPLVARISHDHGMTVVTTFDKDFYDRRVR